MGYETINVTPVTPRIGAEVDGLTLAKPLSNRQVEELHQALAEHQVLFFRDQPLDVEGHKAFGRYFGDLHIHPNTPGPEGHPEILPIHADANSKRIAGEYWHSDVSCDEEPPLGSILYLHTVPPVGGDTLFASQYAAYDALSPRMKTYLERLTATHSGEHVYRATNVLVGRDDRGKVFPKASHPIIRAHPVSRRKALFVNQGFTTHCAPLGPPDPRAPPCIRHRLFPATAGDRHGFPDLVLATHRTALRGYSGSWAGCMGSVRHFSPSPPPLLSFPGLNSPCSAFEPAAAR